MLGILTREYGIKPTEALTEYTEDELQLLLSQLPTDRLLKVDGKLSDMQINNKYMALFCDRDVDTVKDAHALYELKDRRAKAKAKLRSAQSPEETLRLNEEIANLTKQIEEA